MQRRPALRRAVPLGATLVALGWLATRTHQNGHDWGDDFALYIRQARGIVEGFPAEVGRDNRATLATSGWHTFSPEVYPWGFPLLLAPIVTLRGVDFAALKAVGVVAWCAALLLWHGIVRRRAGRPMAWCLMVLLGVSWPFVVWTNSIASDLPYLAVAFGGLAVLDRCRERRWLAAGSRWQLVAIGLMFAGVFNVRREGLAVAIAFAALVVIERRRDRQSVDLRRVGTVIGTALAATAAFQLVLPSVLFPRYPGTGLGNVPRRFAWYIDIAAQQVNLAGPHDDGATLVGSAGLGHLLLVAVAVLAVVGVVSRCIVSPSTDIPLAAFAGAHSAVVLMSPFQEGRYLFPIVPVLMWFAAAAPSAVAALVQRRRDTDRTMVHLPAFAVIAVLTVAGLSHTWRWADTATSLRDAGAVQNGPATPEAQEMFAAVIAHAHPDDVVAFFRARAMTLMTERSSLQAIDLDTIVRNADWYAMERGSTYSQPLISLDEAETNGLDRVWSNGGWILFRVTDEAKAALDPSAVDTAADSS